MLIDFCHRKFPLLLAVVATMCISPSRLEVLKNTNELVVQTTTGPVRGKTLTSGGKEVDGFLGIPYAKPPIGELRFNRPLPIDPWKDIFNATELGNSCIQNNDTKFGPDFRGSTVWNPNTQLSEDCLTLNIWVPKPRPKSSAVLVWIHGGGFYSGTSTLDLYDGKIISTEENIIMASINYRVGSLGFLQLGLPDAPGNVGLFDQTMALQWIKDNIANFGGDPNRIAISGESAGAWSVGFHLISPLSRNLYSRAILQSGSITASYTTLDIKESIKRGLLLAKDLKCPNDASNMKEVLQCLRTKDPFEMVRAEWTHNYGVFGIPFMPIVDGVFITESPQKSFATKNFNQVNLLLGSNAQEGSYFIIYGLSEYFPKQEDVHIDRKTFFKILEEIYPTMDKLGIESIAYVYTDWKRPRDSINYADAIIRIVGDSLFMCPTSKLGLIYAQAGNDVYMYFFQQRYSVNPWPSWMGVLHADEINFVFGDPLKTTLTYTQDERILSKRMMRYWCNFVKTGNPNLTEDGRYELYTWPIHTASKRESLALSSNSTEILTAKNYKNCAFWNYYQPKVLEFSKKAKP